MNSDALAAARERLNEVEQTRRRSESEDSIQNVDLRREESELRSQIIRLQDAALQDYDTQEIPGVPGAPVTASLG